MPRIAFYISGHGFGHVMRMKELLLRLRDADSSVEIFVMGSMPAWVFAEGPAIPLRRRELRCDVGAIQRDSLHLDVVETLRQNAEFYRAIGPLVSREAEFLRRGGIDLVVGDIPPLAFLAADAAGLRSVGVGNFSWDWIYEEYVERFPRYRYLANLVKEAYGRAHLLLRLPFHGDMSAFRSIRDIPLITRKASMTREEVRLRLGIERGEKLKVVFVSMGGHDNAGLIGGAGDFGDHLLISFFPMGEKAKYIILPEEKGGMQHQDIVNASDLVISKPGYSTVSECIANRTPLMYTSRDDFREFAVMEEGVRKYCQSYHMPRGDFLGGMWRTHLDAFFARSGSFRWPEIPIDGAETAARIILGLL